MSYQERLRVVGQWIDDHARESFRVLEGPNGFTILLQAGPVSSEHDLSFEEIDRIAEEMRARREDSDEERAEMPAEEVPRGYRDTLRALGTRLDNEKAALVMVDQVGDELLVTFSAIDPMRVFAWHKHHFTLGPGDTVEMVRTSSARRRPVEQKRAWWRRR